MAYIDELREHYKHNGILSTSFTCKSRRACALVNTDSGPKSAFVGSKYGWGLPRLLFISLDAGWAEPCAAKRTPEAVRDELERVGAEKSAPNTHWYRTHELAHAILSQFDSSLRLKTITPHFAHTNASKCCPSGEKGGNASQVAYLNCHRYLKGEIEVLDPDVVVTQGREAEVGIRALLADEAENPTDEFAAEELLCGRRRFLLRTDHPRYVKGFYKQREQSRCWAIYAEAIQRFYSTIPERH